MIKGILKDKLFVSLSVAFVTIALAYPVTVTFDSGHYMWLADLIRDGAWSDWDPIRGVVFPLFLYLSTSLLGRNGNALLLPMIFSQTILFLFAIHFVLLATNITQTVYKKIIIIFVFVVLMFDPIVFGYYHTMLTESFAATFAILSIYVSYQFYCSFENFPKLSKSFFYSSLFFFLAVPFAWHLKQPYIGISLYPLLLSSFMVVIRYWHRRKIILYLFVVNIVTLFFLLGSVFLWSSFLNFMGMPAKPSRELSGFVERAYEREESADVLDSPMSFLRDRIKKYLRYSNLYSFDRKTKTYITDISFTRAFQNNIIASRMYYLNGESNIFYMTDKLKSHVRNFSTGYYSPLWFSSIQISRQKISNIMFTGSYLLVPFVLLFSVLFFIREKTTALAIIVLASGSSFLNALSHTISFVGGIDRYLFWGYPLNLLILIILLVKLGDLSIKEISKGREKNEE